MTLNMRQYWRESWNQIVGAIKIREKLYKDAIVVLYHSMSASHDEFVRFLEDVIEELIVKGECIVTRRL